MARPVLRYHGGKWRLASWVLEHFPPHRIYVEPYGGAASVLLRKPRSYAEVYNDLHGEIVDLFRVLRDPAQAAELERLLRLTPFARDEFRGSYEKSDDLVEQARRTVIRSFMSFAPCAFVDVSPTAGFRSSCNRPYTIPAHDWASYPAHVAAFTKRLAGVVIDNRPALEVIQQHDAPSTLFYADPPYLQSTRSMGHRTAYTHEMSDDDHRELAEALHGCEGMVVISGYPSPLYDELYAGWDHTDHHAMTDGTHLRTERLWLSPATQRARMPLFNHTGG